MQLENSATRIDLALLRQMKASGRKLVMLTAYDYPTAALAQEAGVHMLLIGDSLATVLLGHENTRAAPFELMLMLGAAVRRGAPRVYLVGDMPFSTLSHGPQAAAQAACRFRDEAGCDAVKLEAGPADLPLIEAVVGTGIATIVHLGLRPQQVLTPDGYKAQARDADAIGQLVGEARQAVAAGASMLLLEAVPPEASAAVVAAVPVPVIGCGAGPACDGHVVVTQDMLGFGTIRPPRFVPLKAQLGPLTLEAMRRWVADVVSGDYPTPAHAYALRSGERRP
jgi:3-methyl-2-oxobutanoate hydroxymethyltransferase